MVSDPRRDLGALGEGLACQHLRRIGYAVLERNFRTAGGEIDVVASDERFLVFCEVKTRIGWGEPGGLGPLDAIGQRKRRQLRRMAREWLVRRCSAARPRPPQLRFDAIGVSVSPSGRLLHLEHVENAF